MGLLDGLAARFGFLYAGRPRGANRGERAEVSARDAGLARHLALPIRIGLSRFP